MIFWGSTANGQDGFQSSLNPTLAGHMTHKTSSVINFFSIQGEGLAVKAIHLVEQCSCAWGQRLNMNMSKCEIIN